MGRGKKTETVIAQELLSQIEKDDKKRKSTIPAPKKLEVPAESVQELRIKQIRFAKEYVDNGGNATQAALKAGYKPTNAPEMGCQNLKKPNVQKLIQDFLVQRMDSEQVTSDWKMQKMMKVTEKLYHLIQENDSSRDAAALSSAMAKLVSEMNKMQGHYAPERTVNWHAVAVLDERMEKLIDENWEDF